MVAVLKPELTDFTRPIDRSATQHLSFCCSCWCGECVRKQSQTNSHIQQAKSFIHLYLLVQVLVSTLKEISLLPLNAPRCPPTAANFGCRSFGSARCGWSWVWWVNRHSKTEGCKIKKLNGGKMVCPVKSSAALRTGDHSLGARQRLLSH